ncbi:MAG: hypothetical protein ACM3JB_13610 [Acidobacteriaceae bacterium]
MQAVKDSFYMTLRQRLEQLYPLRTLAGDGRPAILVCENEHGSWTPSNDAFYLRWMSDAKLPPDASSAGWRALACEISYRTAGTESAAGEDRGRALAELEAELLAILDPEQSPLLDYTQDPPADLRTTLLWTSPVLQDAKDNNDVLGRSAHVTVLWQEGVQAS